MRRVAFALKLLHPSVVSGFVAEFDELMLDKVEKLAGLGLQSALLLSPWLF